MLTGLQIGKEVAMQIRPEHILIVEDEPVTRNSLVAYLESFGYNISQCDTAEKAEKILGQASVDLLIVDINLQGKDGLEITREERARSEIGIILLSGRTDDVDRIVGLELGADDYVCKPFSRRELLARVKNLLRRTAAMRALSRKIVQFNGLKFDVASRQIITSSGDQIMLTRAEYELLRVFVTNPGIVMNRDRLTAAITHRQDCTNTRSIDVLVQRLRTKLGDTTRPPRIFTTSHGEGYVFTAQID
jgi:two-component system, OmpR family, torCAD operon response regulator TorR